MSTTNKPVNPYVYNTDLIPEHLWFYTATIVLKRKANVDADRKILNKQTLKWLHATYKSVIGEDLIVPYAKWFATCSSETQKHSGLLHFHLLYGNIYNVKATSKKPNIVYGKRKEIADLTKNLIEITPFLGTTTEYYSIQVKPYILKRNYQGKSWIGYKFKKEMNPYWSDYYQRMVALKNQADADDGVIPQILLDLGFQFTLKRKILHNNAIDEGYGDTTYEYDNNN